MERIDTINTRLADLFGKNHDGRPWYRLVWSTDQTEVRRGNYNVFYGNIYLRTEENVTKEVPKYQIGRDRWVLEKLILGIVNPEIPNSMNGSYEPIWFFQDKNGNYLHPIWPAIEFIVKAAEGRIAEKLIPSDIEEDERKKLQEEIKAFEEMIGEASDPAFPFQNHAVISKTDMWEKD